MVKERIDFMPKRGENIHKRKDGRWEARILTDTGKRKSVYAKSYYEVKKKVRLAQEEKETQFKEHGSLIFEQVSKEWIKESEIKNKKSTTSKYWSICKTHLISYFGKMKIHEIDRNHINTFIQFKLHQGKLQPKTICDITKVLLQIIRYAYNQGYTENNNFDITMPKVQTKELEVLTQAEQTRLVALIKKKVTSENIGILLSLYAGMRLGEICALQWKDIDLNNSTISVTKTMQRISVKNTQTKTAIIIDTPKSQKSIRKIPIPYFLLTELKSLSKHSKQEDYILTSSNTQYIEPRMYQYKFKKYLKNAGVTDINFHALRHTFATRAVEQGMDIKSLSEILGHATVGFTLDRYVHPSFNLKKQNIEKLAVCY